MKPQQKIYNSFTFPQIEIFFNYSASVFGCIHSIFQYNNIHFPADDILKPLAQSINFAIKQVTSHKNVFRQFKKAMYFCYSVYIPIRKQTLLKNGYLNLVD